MLPRFSGVDCPSMDPRQPLCSPLSCPISTALRGLQPQLFSLLSSHQLPLLSSHQLPVSCPTTNSLGSSHQLCSPATNSLSWAPATNCLSALLPSTASLWVASSTLIRVPLPLPDTARFQVQESFVWFRAKTDSSALAAYPHSATLMLNRII